MPKTKILFKIILTLVLTYSISAFAYAAENKKTMTAKNNFVGTTSALCADNPGVTLIDVPVNGQTFTLDCDVTPPQMAINLNGSNGNEDDTNCNIRPEPFNKNNESHYSANANVCETKWSQTPITITWAIREWESSLVSANVTITKNGNIIAGYNNRDLTLELESSFSTPSNQEGLYELQFTLVDFTGLTLNKTFQLKYDKTQPSLSWTGTGLGYGGKFLAGPENWNITIDDINNGNTTGSSNPSHVATVQKDTITLSIQKCLSENCLATTPLYSSQGNTELINDTNWTNVSGLTWNDFVGNQTISASIAMYHSRYYQTNTTGKYIVTLVGTDQAGNQTTLPQIVDVFPNQLDATQSSIIPNIDCSNNTWRADKETSCSVQITAQDIYQNPLYDHELQLYGFSQTVLDSIHYSDPIEDPEQEAIHYLQNGNIIINPQGITDSSIFISNTAGTVDLELVSYAPSFGDKIMYLQSSARTHNANNYLTHGTGDFNQSNENSTISYNIESVFDGAFPAIANTFIKNSPKTFQMNITQNDFPELQGEAKLALYTQIDIANIFSVDSPNNSLITETRDSWMKQFDTIGAEKTLQNNYAQTQLTANLTKDGFSSYSTPNLVTGTHDFQLNFTKVPGAKESITTIKLIPFVAIDSDGKRTAYKTGTAKNSKVYNTATEAQGSGFVQSSSTNISQIGDETAKKAFSSLPFSTLLDEVKKKVKQSSINLKDANSNNNHMRSLSDIDANVQQINNRRTYIVRSGDLYITGDSNGNFQLGAEPVSFISIGGNIIIESNVLQTNSPAPTTAFIALMDEETGIGGEIHILGRTHNDAYLHTVNGVLIAEKGVLASYPNIGVDMSTEKRGEMIDQLKVTGAVLSINTMGGGDVPLKCPTFVRITNCDDTTAQKYDLGYIRRYIPGEGEEIVSGSFSPIVIDYALNKNLLPNELFLFQ